MSQAVKVGIFAFVALLILGWFVLRIEDLRLFEPEGTRLTAEFESVAGLDDRAAVRVAGVRVGRVDGIELASAQGRTARVHLQLERSLELTEGTSARLATSGLLGDRYVELVPGPAAARALPEGAVVPGETPATVDQALGQLSEVGESIAGLTGTVQGTLDRGDLDRLIENLAATSEEIRRLVEANRQNVDATASNFRLASQTLARELPRLSEQMSGVIEQISAILEENRGQLQGSLANAEELTREMQTSVENFNQISGRIARGEGTLGKLVTSDRAHEELVSTLDSIQGGVEGLSETLGAARRLHLDLGFQSFYLEDAEEAQNTFRLDLFSGERQEAKRFYRLALVDGARGEEETSFERITVTRPDGTVETTEIETLRRDDDPTVSALFGFRGPRDLRLWAGLIEDSGGFQIEYPLLRKKLWLSLEAFDFDRSEERDAHLRIFGRYHVNRHLYLMGGYDDFLESDQDSFFLGGGVTWSDDTLKSLLGTAASAGL